MPKMIISLVVIIIIVQCSYAQRKVEFSDEQKVMSEILDFKKILFSEMNVSKAIENHYFLGQIDATDSNFGLKSNFLDLTESVVKKEDRVRYFAMQFYWVESWYGGLLPLTWWLGTNKITDNINLANNDNEMAQNKELAKLWNGELKKLGLLGTKSLIDLDESNFKNYEILTKKLNSAISKKLKKQFLNENLKFINKKAKITKELFEGREYYKVVDSIFIYTMTKKNEIMKIVNIKTNY